MQDGSGVTAPGGGSAPPENPAAVSAGPASAPSLIADRYELGEVIGRGGMAEVRRGRDVRLGREVAVKVLLPELVVQPELRRRFELEAVSAARLNHPNVVTVFDTGEADVGPFIVMERLSGRTFADEMAEGPVTEARALQVARSVLGALEAAHGLDVLHRDVKPANLLLTADGEVKIADFGIARVAEGVDLTMTGQMLGTPAYMAPERLRGGSATPDGDLYSLGVVLYEALTGIKAFVGATPLAVALAATTTSPEPLAERRPDLGPSLCTAIARAMSPEPAARFPSANEMAAALDPLAPTAVMPVLEDRVPATLDPSPGNVTTEVRQPTAGVPTPVRPPRRSSARLLVGATAVVLAAGAWLLVRSDGGPPGEGPSASTSVQGDVDGSGTGQPTVEPAPPLMEEALDRFEELLR